jgi:hypothetical protein
MKLFVLLVFIFLLVSAANAQNTFSSYGNSRFEFLVDYPADLLTPEPESDNHDGRKFTSSDGSVEMLAWGSFNVMQRSVAQEFKNAVESESGITYKKAGDKWFVLSGIKAGKIFYRRTVYEKSSDSFASISITYPEAKKKTYASMVQRIAKSLKFIDEK